ncbi:MAG: WD40/YVTN/BNR-like repeat-containing protein [Cyclobacteriaceae bacterium]
MRRLTVLLIGLLLISGADSLAQRKKKATPETPKLDASLFVGLKWRNIGPYRGGRSVTSTGVIQDPMTFYMGSTGGGVWKTTDGGISWNNISDGFFKTGTVGAIAVAPSDPNVVYVGMGEHAIRGVMTSSGDGMYKSTDAGMTWKHIGLPQSFHIANIIVHPVNPEVLYVAVQGAQHGPTSERGVYRSMNGGTSWEKVLYVNDQTGAASLSMDPSNPRILYAAMWQHMRYPWQMVSGGEGSGLYKSVDGGDNWTEMTEGLPEKTGKMGISVSGANPNRVWAVIEAEGEKGGVYRSDDGGKKWSQVNKNRVAIARSWYYMEVFADPQDDNVVYVLNAPVLKSIDGGKSFTPIAVPHGDNHHLWVHPENNKIMVNSNDGGANVTYNGGKSWSSQRQQPTSQFYRVIADEQVPYYVYGGQQDNSAIAIASRTNDQGIDWKDWYSVAGCESAYLAFDPKNPVIVYGGCYQGIIEQWNMNSNEGKPIKAYPELSLGNLPAEFKFRFNWNAPIISSQYDRKTIYHAGNMVFKTTDGGINWEIISADMTRNNKNQQVAGGSPYTNEAAGGENYNTIMYLAESPHQEGELWSGSDDGLVFITRDGGQNWKNITPAGMPEGIVNSIDLSDHQAGKAVITLMRYKFNDLKPYVYMTKDYGTTWKRIDSGIKDPYTFTRVVREDKEVEGLLYAGTETGLYVSWNDGQTWDRLQLNLPVVPINDLMVHRGDLIAATAGRSFWILDDLGAIRQWNSPTRSVLFKPKDSYRILGGYQEKPSPAVGQNPPSGVTFDYFLPEELADSVELTVNIKDLEGTLIRTYSNQKVEAFKSWPGGPPKPKVLTAKKGINRFTWDFRKEALPSVDGVFVYGDYRGAVVAPGEYVIEMVLTGDTMQVPARVLPNPKIQASALEYLEQQDYLAAIESDIKSIHAAVNAMRSAKSQLKSYQKLLEDHEEAVVLLDTAKSLLKAIDEWEQELIQPSQKTFQDVINYNNKLNAEFMQLKSFIDVADPQVTQGAKDRFADLESEWKVFSDAKDELVDQKMKQFNDMYRELALPAVIFKED